MYPSVSRLSDIGDSNLRNMILNIKERGLCHINSIAPKDALLIGICEMIGELQQEVTNLKEQLNTIGKNI
jgi:hypothetical protein